MPEYMQEMLPDDNVSMPKQEENDHRAFIPNVHFELIPIKNLVSNQEYHRFSLAL